MPLPSAVLQSDNVQLRSAGMAAFNPTTTCLQTGALPTHSKVETLNNLHLCLLKESIVLYSCHSNYLLFPGVLMSLIRILYNLMMDSFKMNRPQITGVASETHRPCRKPSRGWVAGAVALLGKAVALLGSPC